MGFLDAVVLHDIQEQSVKVSAVLLQMQKHADKLQQEKEEQCMSNIKSEMPTVSPAVLALALHEVDWDVRAAVQLVSLFMDARGVELNELQKVLHSLPVYLIRRSSVARLKYSHMACRVLLRPARTRHAQMLSRLQAQMTAAHQELSRKRRARQRKTSPKRTRSTKSDACRE